MPIVLNLDKKMPLEYSNLDDKTKEVSKSIYELSKGITLKQFTDAIEFALESVSDYLILKDELHPLKQ